MHIIGNILPQRGPKGREAAQRGQRARCFRQSRRGSATLIQRAYCTFRGSRQSRRRNILRPEGPLAFSPKAFYSEGPLGIYCGPEAHLCLKALFTVTPAPLGPFGVTKKSLWPRGTAKDKEVAQRGNHWLRFICLKGAPKGRISVLRSGPLCAPKGYLKEEVPTNSYPQYMPSGPTLFSPARRISYADPRRLLCPSLSKGQAIYCGRRLYICPKGTLWEEKGTQSRRQSETRPALLCPKGISLCRCPEGAKALRARRAYIERSGLRAFAVPPFGPEGN